MQLPLRLDLNLMQQKWASILNPLLAKEIVQGKLLENQVLTVGNNPINHMLGRPIAGYQIVRRSAAISYFDSTSNTPDLTFILNSSAPAVVSIWVF